MSRKNKGNKKVLKKVEVEWKPNKSQIMTIEEALQRKKDKEKDQG